MKVFIAADHDGFELKEHVKTYLVSKGFDIVDTTPTDDGKDFVDITEKLVQEIKTNDESRGIIFDRFAVGSYMVANKFKGIICAAVSDEHSAMMTIRHNSTRIITLGSGIVGKDLACSCAESYLTADYDGGRHQVRIDMLNKLC